MLLLMAFVRVVVNHKKVGFFLTILLFPTIKSVKLSESPKTAYVVLQKHWKHENLLVQFCLQFCLPTRSAMCFPAEN